MNTSDHLSQLDVLAKLCAQPALRARWPEGNATLTLEAALIAREGETARGAVQRELDVVRARLAILATPIVAVLGQLNAGKSSVVASFLSPASRKRVPRGEEEAQGTHRFVYWVPSSCFADAAKKAAFFELLEAAHGPEREFLADDPATAAEQYRAGRDDLAKLRIPLVAEDPALDDFRAVLLDCPDIQTADAGLATSSTHRLEMLVQAARICSALLVVWLRRSVRDGLLDRMLASLRERLPQAPLFLLLNMIEPERGQPTRTRADTDVAALLDRYGIPRDGVFGAFHFRIGAQGGQPGWRELTPPALAAKFAEDEPLPQFFQIAEDAAENDPTTIAESRFLARLPARLDFAEIQRRNLRSAWAALARTLREKAETVRAFAREQAQRAAELHAGLLAFCVEELTDLTTGEARQVLTPEFASAFQDSLRRTAPWWVWIAMQGARPVNWLGGRLTTGAKRLASTAGDILRGRLAAGEFQRRFGEAYTREFPEHPVAFADAESLGTRMKARRWVPAELSEKALAEAWATALRHFRRHPLSVDATELDRLTRELWQALGFWQKLKFSVKNFLAAVGGLVAAAGAIFVVIDGGAMMMATFSLSAWIASVIPGKLILAATVAGGATFAASLALRSIQVNTLPYLARWFAFACDVFALPRRLEAAPVRVTFGRGPAAQTSELPDPAVPVQDPVCRLADVRLWEEAPALREIENLSAE